MILILMFVSILNSKSQCPTDSLDFSWSLTNNCQPVSFVSFANFGNGVYTYKWSFGDGTNSSDNTAKSPTHIYKGNSGSSDPYIVSLTVTDSKKKSCIITKTINVKPSPIILGDTSAVVSLPFVHCIPQGAVCELKLKNKSPYFNSHYTIDWGDGTLYDGDNFPDTVVHVFPKYKQYVVTASSPGGCIAYNFFCGSNPAGGIACPGNRLACVGLQLDFPIDAQTLANPQGTTYTIKFDDGSPDVKYDQSTLPAVISHIYQGNTKCIPLYATMTASNPCSPTTSSCGPIYVSKRPEPDIGVDMRINGVPTSANCANLTQYTFKNATSPCCIKIDGSKDNAVKVTWGITPNTYKILKGKLDSTMIKVVFNNIGCYELKMRVQYQNLNCSNCGDTNTYKTICLDSLPIAKATADFYDNFGTCFLPLSDHFINLSKNAKTYLWDIKPYHTDPKWSVIYTNGSNNTSVSPKVNFAEADTFKVTLNASNQCGTSKDFLKITTISSPLIVIDKPLSFCGPDSFNLHIDENSIKFINVGPKTTYSWTVSPPTGVKNPTSNLHYPDFIFNNKHIKSYTLKFTADNNNGCPATTDSTLMNFTDKPQLLITPDKNSICIGDSVKLNVKDISINNGNNIVYKWLQSDTLGGLKDSTGNNIYVTPKKTTTYTVIGNLRNDTLCKDITRVTITVNNLPLSKITPNDTTICIGQKVKLNAFGGLNYKWFNNGATTQSITVSPTDTTIYTVEVTGVNGCKQNASARVNVVPIPNVLFSNKSIEFVNKNVYFNNLSIDATSFDWNFGDGAMSQDTFPVHKYKSPGTYTIDLKGKSPINCFDEDSHKIKIVTNVPFIIQSDSGCSPFTLKVITKIIDPELQFFWDFGYNKITSTLANPPPVTYVTNKDAIYNVTLYIIYNSDTIKSVVKVHVFAKPQADFTLDPKCGCPILKVNITNRSQSALPFSCLWYFGNGRTFYEPPFAPHRPVNVQTYTGKTVDSTYYVIMLTDSNRCGISIHKDTIVVFPDNIIVDFSPDKVNVCAGEIIHFTNKSKFYNSLYWDFGDSSKNDETNPIHHYDKAGVYTVKLTAYNQCLSCGGETTTSNSSHSMQITVNALPILDFTIDNDDKLCENKLVSFHSTTNTPLSDIYWDFGDPASGALNYSNAVNPTHLYKNDGIYEVKFKGRSLSANPCTDSVIKTVTINQKPLASFKDTSFCAGEEGVFINTSQNYKSSIWYFGDGESSNVSSPPHTYENAGDYQVKLIVKNGVGCSDSVKSTISIYNIPSADFSYSSSNDLSKKSFTTIFKNNSTDTCKYQWDFGDGNYSNEKDPVHLYKTITSYLVKLKVTNLYNCTSEISKLIEPEAPHYYFYVPNAFSPGSATLNNTFYPIITYFSDYHMKIFNRWGGMVFETYSYDKHWDGNYNGAACPEGTYIYMIEVKEGIGTGESHTYNGYVVLLRKN